MNKGHKTNQSFAGAPSMRGKNAGTATTKKTQATTHKVAQSNAALPSKKETTTKTKEHTTKKDESKKNVPQKKED